jgi:hypothetical protein
MLYCSNKFFSSYFGTETLGSPKTIKPIDTMKSLFIIVGDTGVETIEPIDLSNYAKNYVDHKTNILSIE